METRGLRFLYNTYLGRMFLKIISARWISRLCGRYMDSRLSVRMVPGFIEKHNILMNEYEKQDYKSFNDFFTRKIIPSCRNVCKERDALIAPCDGLLSIYDINDDTLFEIKNSFYDVKELLKDEELAKLYRGGLCLVFRLCVHHYHRYCYIDDGVKGDNIYIPGVLHTVRPIAFERYRIFHENAREYTVIDTENFGRMVQMEVGAMLVGKIKNNGGRGCVKRGTEKGMFLYGGSTIVVLLEKNRVCIDRWEGEREVVMGSRLN